MFSFTYQKLNIFNEVSLLVSLRITMLKDLLNSIEQYLDSTTVHGFQYVQKRYHWFLRFIWVSNEKLKLMYAFSTQESQFIVCYFLGNHHCSWVLSSYKYIFPSIDRMV